VKITGFDGKLIEMHSPEANQYEFPLDAVGKGVYIVSIFTNNGVFENKLVVF
jgi:hypothetical protein